MNVHGAYRKAFVAIILVSFFSLTFFAACSSPKPTTEVAPTPTEAGIVLESIVDFIAFRGEIAAMDAVEAQTRVDEVWQELVSSGRVPLVLGDKIAFLYKGKAESVSFSGVFNGWSVPGLAAMRVGSTDLWYQFLQVPLASRIEYKIILNGTDWITDPVNPATALSGLTGENSLLTMPGFSVSDYSQPVDGVSAGSETGEFSIASSYLGFDINYWVYLPAGYEQISALPVVYFLDGNDFIDPRMDAIPTILDNLIAQGKIKPVIAVLVDERDPANQEFNRREVEFLQCPLEHAEFIAKELVPTIDQAYKTNANPDSRTIVGVSYGGLSAMYIAASQPDTFHNLAAFSPAVWVLNVPQYLPKAIYAETTRVMVEPLDSATKCGDDTGTSCPRFPIKIFISYGVPEWDVSDLGPLAENLVDHAYPVKYIAVNEGHAWSAWRGLTDEMLIYFYGK